MENITENKIRKWIESFHLSNNTETDKHITDFFSPNLERKEWLKKGFLLSKECQNYIDSHEYPIRVYLGISLKDRRKEFIPEGLTLDDVISTVSTANTINSYNRCYISIIRFSK